jgi:methylamine dehydrogenase heavy chain
MKRVALALGAALVAAAGWPVAARAAEPLAAEAYFTESLPQSSPHWVFVNDFNFFGYLDGKVYLFDGDSGQMLGMMSTGAYQNAIEIAPDFSAIYSPVTFYARHSRGARTDALVIYDTKSLHSGDDDEVVIPPKRATGMPQRGYSGISDDGRFVYVANMTPASSVSVVDVAARTFVGEIETPGCALVYPTGPRSFASLCGDGTLATFVLDDAGAVVARGRTPKFFDPEADPVTEKASRLGATWLFVSFEGYVHPVDFAAGAGTPREKWSLFGDAERAAGWRPGGSQFTAVHEGLGRLYVIVNQGGRDAHKNPGEQVWVYDLKRRKRAQVIEVGGHVTAIAVSRDAAPLLYGTTLDAPVVRVLDARSGSVKHVIEGGPLTPGFPQVP